MSASTVSTRFIIISDTHNYEFDQAKAVSGAFVRPIPRADVLLHCGDLTGVGGLSSYKKCLLMMKEIPAELKLVIAGNHDLSLDKKYWESHLDERNDPEEHEKGMEIMKGPLAKEAGVTYLEEGMHTFTLKNGVTFTVYASPYQPEFCDWAFPYYRHEDRFNIQAQSAPNVTSIAQNPVPDFPNVDIMMTHGPPEDILDWTAHGGVGCLALLRAVSRARPKMHCFGHIHEAYGCNLVTWKDDKTLIGADAIEKKSERYNLYPDHGQLKLIPGKETLFVNAAIMNLSYKPTNSPWLIDLDLQKGA